MPERKIVTQTEQIRNSFERLDEHRELLDDLAEKRGLRSKSDPSIVSDRRIKEYRDKLGLSPDEQPPSENS